MLTHLRIQNIGLIAGCDLSFLAGLTVITGETGAGKSMFIDALSLALGARSTSSLIRHGEKTASVEATFNVTEHPHFLQKMSELDIDVEDGEVVFRRTLDGDKSKCFLSGVRLTQTQMKELGDTLVDIHGQYDHQQILNQGRHAFMLDHFARLSKHKQNVEQSYKHYNALRKELKKQQDLIKNREEEETLLTAYIEELESIAYISGEEEELSAERRRLMSSEKLIDGVNTAVEVLSENGSVAERFSQAEKALLPLTLMEDESLNMLFERVTNLSIEVGELLSDVERLGSDFEADPQRLSFVDERLFTLRDCARKHRTEVSDLPALLEEMKTKRDQLSNLGEHLTALEEELEAAWKVFKSHCIKLSEMRAKGAADLAGKIEKSLGSLEMPKTRFNVHLELKDEQDWDASGAEKVEFMVATNAGAPLNPLVKIASGGEVSRLMLALKKVFYSAMPRTTLVFDEVDTGVGGKVADAMGDALKEISENHQVFSITHLPQVAAKGQTHLKILKDQREGDTETNLHLLNNKERLEEIARMLAGKEVTEHARAAAKSLLAS